MRNDGGIQFVPAHPQAAAEDDSGEGDDCNFTSPAANVHDHVARRFMHRQAEANGRSIKYTSRAPAWVAESFTARFSTSVMPEGTATTTRGAINLRWWTFWMKWRSIASVISKSAITPSFMGRMATIFPGVRPNMRLASSPTARTLVVPA